MKYILIISVAMLFLNSCANKKEILYLQDAEAYNNSVISYSSPTIQPNDILKITVGALEAETAVPYNRTPSGSGQGGGSEMMQLDGYIVTEQNTINFPELGVLSTKDKSVLQLQQIITQLLQDGGHLNNPNVNVRLLNAKVTVLGEVKGPGIFSFTEQNISLLQALGFAGDLTINGKRDDILIIRETNGLRQITHVDLTSAELFDSPFFNIQTNDVIIVNPNEPKIKSSGFVGNIGTLISVISILLSTIILITR